MATRNKQYSYWFQTSNWRVHSHSDTLNISLGERNLIQSKTLNSVSNITAIIIFDIFVLLLHFRYVVPPEHGKRLERLAKGT